MQTKQLRLCYISRNYKTLKTGGGKAKTDIELTLGRMGAVNLGLKQTRHSNKTYDFFRNLSGVMYALSRCRKGDVVVLQYPVKKYFDFICRFVRWRSGYTIAIIHDLGCFRRKRLTVEQEIARLNRADVVIAPNDYQKQWLIDHGCRAHITIYGLHDYLTDRIEPYTYETLATQFNQSSYSLCFVGTLSERKNGYIYELGRRLDHTKVHLYGNHFSEKAATGSRLLINHGFSHDEEIIRARVADFGLSWYGDLCDGAQGNLGEYMEINNPHKISLYLRCGMPVILWKRAGLADVIEREGIGFCVDSLFEIEERLDALTDEQYRTMLKNVARISAEIAEGQSCRKAVLDAYDWLSEYASDGRLKDDR